MSYLIEGGHRRLFTLTTIDELPMLGTLDLKSPLPVIELALLNFQTGKQQKL